MPYPHQIFQPMVQFSITIISQVLGLENDQSVDELTLGFLFTFCVLNEFVQVPNFNFVEYLAKTIILSCCI